MTEYQNRCLKIEEKSIRSHRILLFFMTFSLLFLCPAVFFFIKNFNHLDSTVVLIMSCFFPIIMLKVASSKNIIPLFAYGLIVSLYLIPIPEDEKGWYRSMIMFPVVFLLLTHKPRK